LSYLLYRPEKKITVNAQPRYIPDDASKLISNSGIFNDTFHLMLQIYILQPFTDNGIKLDGIFEMDPMGTFQRLE
jgi:hypothetical protein